VFSTSQLETSTNSASGAVSPAAAASREAKNSLASTRMCCGLFWNFTTYTWPSAPSINWPCAPPRIRRICCTARTAKPVSRLFLDSF
jgi:hypothetical protein